MADFGIETSDQFASASGQIETARDSFPRRPPRKKQKNPRGCASIQGRFRANQKCRARLRLDDLFKLKAPHISSTRTPTSSGQQL